MTSTYRDKCVMLPQSVHFSRDYTPQPIADILPRRRTKKAFSVLTQTQTKGGRSLKPSNPIKPHSHHPTLTPQTLLSSEHHLDSPQWSPQGATDSKPPLPSPFQDPYHPSYQPPRIPSSSRSPSLRTPNPKPEPQIILRQFRTGHPVLPNLRIYP